MGKTPEKLREEIGERARSLRKRAGFSSADSAAEAMGVSNSAVYQVERGENLLTAEMLLKMATTYNAPEAAFYPGYETKPRADLTPREALAVLSELLLKSSDHEQMSRMKNPGRKDPSDAPNWEKKEANVTIYSERTSESSKEKQHPNEPDASKDFGHARLSEEIIQELMDRIVSMERKVSSVVSSLQSSGKTNTPALPGLSSDETSRLIKVLSGTSTGTKRVRDLISSLEPTLNKTKSRTPGSA